MLTNLFCLYLQFDPEGFGEIPVDDFVVALKSPEFQSQVPVNKRELLYDRAMKAKLPQGPGFVSFQDFVNVVSGNKEHKITVLFHKQLK